MNIFYNIKIKTKNFSKVKDTIHAALIKTNCKNIFNTNTCNIKNFQKSMRKDNQ